MNSNPLNRYSATCQTRGLRKEAEKEEKTARFKLMQHHGCTELDAAAMIGEQIAKGRRKTI